MKYCPNCGQPVEEGTKFCATCGAPIQAAQTPVQQPVQTPVQQPVQQPTFPGAAAPQKAATKKEFLELPENAKLKKEINTSGIFCYVCAALSVVVGVLLAGNYAVLLDAVILIGLGLGVHLAKSRVCAIILLVYSVFNVVYLLVSTGRFGGYLIVIAAVYAVINTFKLEKAWKAYRQS